MLKSVYPNWQAIILVSSDAVTATIKSASAAPASRKILGEEGEPLTTRKSCLSCKFCKCWDSLSTSVISLSSLTKFAASVVPTCPAPKMIIFILFSPQPKVGYQFQLNLDRTLMLQCGDKWSPLLVLLLPFFL